MSKGIKLLVVVGIMIGAWWLWQSDAALNAVVLFCTAGVVPFTGTVLSPGQMYLFLGILLFLSVCFMFSRRLIHDLRAVRKAIKYRQGTEAAVSVVQPAAAAVAAPPMIKQAAKSGKARKHKPVPVVDVVIPGEPSLLSKAWAYISPRFIPATKLILQVSGKIITRMIRRMIRNGRNMIIGIYCYSIETWNRTEPHLRDFDKWLERTLKKNKDVAAALHMGGEFVKVVQAWLNAAYSRVQRAVEK